MTGRNLGVLGGPLLQALAVEASGGWLAGSLSFAALTTGAAGLEVLLLGMATRVVAHQNAVAQGIKRSPPGPVTRLGIVLAACSARGYHLRAISGLHGLLTKQTTYT